VPSYFVYFTRIKINKKQYPWARSLYVVGWWKHLQFNVFRSIIKERERVLCCTDSFYFLFETDNNECERIGLTVNLTKKTWWGFFYKVLFCFSPRHRHSKGEWTGWDKLKCSKTKKGATHSTEWWRICRFIYHKITVTATSRKSKPPPVALFCCFLFLFLFGLNSETESSFFFF
jgi:hypothetical protein